MRQDMEQCESKIGQNQASKPLNKNHGVMFDNGVDRWERNLERKCEIQKNNLFEDQQPEPYKPRKCRPKFTQGRTKT